MPHGNSKKVPRWRDRLQRGRAGVHGMRGQGQVPGVGLVHLSSISPCTAPWVLPPLTFPPWLPEFLSSASSSSLTSPDNSTPHHPPASPTPSSHLRLPREGHTLQPPHHHHHHLTISPFWKSTPPTRTTLSSGSHCQPPRQGHVLTLLR